MVRGRNIAEAGPAAVGVATTFRTGGGRAHLPTLDGLRGIAAICVMLFHFGEWAKHGYLAVDFFFLLSGYVIGAAYERKLAAGLRFAPYMRIRIARIYPMLVLGTAIGAAVYWWVAPPADASLGRLSLYVTSALLLVPLIYPVNFFLNVPFWSLFFEMAVNAAHALGLRWLTSRRIAALVALSASALMLIAVARGTINGGLGGLGSLIAVPRVVGGFGLGLLLYRSRALWAGRLPVLHASWPMLALLTVLVLPHGAEPHAVAVIDTLILFTVLPLIVMLGTTARGMGAVSLHLGLLSYPLYALHYPLIEGGLHLSGAMAARWGEPVLFAAAIAIAWVLGRYVDRPLVALIRGKRTIPA